MTFLYNSPRLHGSRSDCLYLVYVRRLEAAPGTGRARGEGEPGNQVSAAFELAFAREPSASERQAAERLVVEHGLVALCRALLNSNELVYLD